MASFLPFSLQWYLTNNPDVAEAVSRGLIDAFEHFQNYGKAEGRSASPLFSADDYLAQNPDVAAAVLRGEITAYDHFFNFGAAEGRAPSSIFDEAFYLLQNPDVAAAVEAGTTTAVQHFLLYGQNEPRPFNPSIDLGAYLDANPDVAAAVELGFASAMGHLLQYGVTESRDLGNGIDLSDFANDPTFTDAIQSGNLQGAMERVGEVAPFIATFVKPANWTPDANTPIPTDFVPLDGQKLVVPEGVVVPPNTQLPDTFVPPTPVTPPETPPGKTFTLTTDVDQLPGTAGNDTFHADVRGSLQSGDILHGGAGFDTLTIAGGALQAGAAPVIKNIEKIVNSDIRYEGASDKTLDLNEVTGLNELQTDFTSLAANTTNQGYANYTNALAATTFGIANVAKQTILVYKGGINVSFKEGQAQDTLNLVLEGNAEGSYYSAIAGVAGSTQSTVLKNVNIESLEGNSGVIVLNSSVEKVTVTGKGNLSLQNEAYNSLINLDASKAYGDIALGVNDATNKSKTLALGESFKIVTGKGNDTFDLSTVLTQGTLNGGDGEDTLTLTDLQNVTVSNVETINIDRTAADAPLEIVKASSFTGAEEIWQIGQAAGIMGLGANQTAGFRYTDTSDAAASVTFTGANAHIALDEVVSGSRFNIEGSTVTSISFTGSVDAAADTDAGVLNIGGAEVEGPSDSLAALNTLNLALSSNTHIHTYSAAFTGLTTINASASTGGLVFGLQGVEGLALESLALGSGSDMVAIATRAFDKPTGEDDHEVTVYLGDGDDHIAVDLSSELVAGGGIDFLLTGGAGNDTFIFTGGNLLDKGEQENIDAVKIADFGTGADFLALYGFNGFTDQNAVNEAINIVEQDLGELLTLFDVVSAVAGVATGVDLVADLTNFAKFEFEGNTYVYGNVAADGLAGDMLIGLAGEVDLNSINVGQFGVG